MAVRLTVVGSSPAWPNPGGAQSGYLVEDGGGRLLLDCGPGVLGRLRELDGALAARRRGRDHALAPRPLGRSRALGVGQRERARAATQAAPSSGFRPRDATGSGTSAPVSAGTTCSTRPSSSATTRSGEPFLAAGFTVLARRLPHYTLLTFGLRVTNGSRSLAYSGDCGPDAVLAELARDVDLFVCEATLERAELDGRPRGHLSADEAIAAFRASGARRLLITHRPGELPLEDGLERAYDGLVIEIG